MTVVTQGDSQGRGVNTVVMIVIAIAMVAVTSNLLNAQGMLNLFGGSGGAYDEVIAMPPGTYAGLTERENEGGYPMYLTPSELPPPPNCEDIGLTDCEWEATSNDRSMRVELVTEDGEVVGRTELLKVQTEEYPELSRLSRAGIREAWIARVEVMEALRGRGLGELLWRAGDMALKAGSGGGAVRVFSDRAGWGASIMRYVPQELFILKESPLWVYIVE